LGSIPCCAPVIRRKRNKLTSVTSVTSVQPLDVTNVTLVAANGGELDPDDWSFNTEPQEVKASMAASDKRD
jgi:hypothetical protein